MQRVLTWFPDWDTAMTGARRHWPETGQKTRSRGPGGPRGGKREKGKGRWGLGRFVLALAHLAFLLSAVPRPRPRYVHVPRTPNAPSPVALRLHTTTSFFALLPPLLLSSSPLLFSSPRLIPSLAHSRSSSSRPPPPRPPLSNASRRLIRPSPSPSSLPAPWPTPLPPPPSPPRRTSTRPPPPAVMTNPSRHRSSPHSPMPPPALGRAPRPRSTPRESGSGLRMLILSPYGHDTAREASDELILGQLGNIGPRIR